MNVDEEEHAHRNYISLHEYFPSDEGNYKRYFGITYDEREKKRKHIAALGRIYIGLIRYDSEKTYG